jgi:AAA ATPase-like protein
MQLTRANNPYSAGAGTMPPVLAGRDKDAETFRVLIERLQAGAQGRSLVYSGLRGVGKTVLLLEFEKIAAEQHWDTTGVVEIGATTDFRTSISRMTHKLLRGLSRKEAVVGRLSQALGVLQAFNITVPGGFKLNLDVSALAGTADTGDIEEDLTELLTEVGRAASAGGKGVVYLIDEMQNLEPIAMSAVCMAFHKVAQQRLPVAMVAAGLPALPTQLRSAKPYAERLFEYFPLGRLSEGAARSALVTPATRIGASYEAGAAELILDAADGYAYFIQECGRVIWEEAGFSPITRAAVDAALPVAREILDEEFFDNRVEGATKEERRYMAAMADLGDGAQHTGQITERAGYKKRTSSGKARQELIRKSLIYSPEYGKVDFTVPHFGDFMRRRYPLQGLLRAARTGDE